MLHVKLIEPPCTERYARWCERSKIPHQEEFSPIRLLLYNRYHNMCRGFYTPPIDIHCNHQRRLNHKIQRNGGTGNERF